MVADAEQLYIVGKNNGEELVTSINNLVNMKNKGNLQNWFNLTLNGNLIAMCPFSGTYAFYNQSGDFLFPVEEWAEIEYLMKKSPRIYFKEGIYLKPEKIHIPEWTLLGSNLLDERLPDNWAHSNNGGDYHFQTTEYIFYNQKKNVFGSVIKQWCGSDFGYTSTGVFTEDMKWYECPLTNGRFSFSVWDNETGEIESSIEQLETFTQFTWEEFLKKSKKDFIQAKTMLGYYFKNFYLRKRGWNEIKSRR